MQEDKDIIVSEFIPKYEKQFPLYQHLEQVLEKVLNDNKYDLKLKDSVSKMVEIYFGESVSDEKYESIQMYHKVFIEPYLGTMQSIVNLFKVLEIQAQVFVWFRNDPPLPAYTFNIELYNITGGLQYTILKELLYLVKNERSHLSSIKNAGEPDMFVWDYSSWDDAYWENAGNIVIDGITFNITRYFNKWYNFNLDIEKYKMQNNTFGRYQDLFSRFSLNSHGYLNKPENAQIVYSSIIRETDTQARVLESSDLLIRGQADDRIFTENEPLLTITINNEFRKVYPDYITTLVTSKTPLYRDTDGSITNLINASNYNYTIPVKNGYAYIGEFYNKEASLEFDGSRLEIPSTPFDEWTIYMLYKVKQVKESGVNTDNTLIKGDGFLLNFKQIQTSQQIILETNKVNVSHSDTWKELIIEKTGNQIKYTIEGQTATVNNDYSLAGVTESICIGNKDLVISIAKMLRCNRILTTSEMNLVKLSYKE